MRVPGISLLRTARSSLFAVWVGSMLVACGGGGGGGTGTLTGTGGSGGGNVQIGQVLNSWGKDSTAFFSGSGSKGGNAGAGGSGANGGAGDGAPIRNATVTITDSSSPAQVATAKTDTDGYYQANITGFKTPLIASVTYKDAANNTVTRYSPSVSALQTNGFITINITGLTTYLAAQVAIKATGNTSAGAADLTPALLASNTATLATATTDLRKFLTDNLSTALKSEISGLGLELATFDPMTAQYIPSTTSGYDTILENVSATTPTTQPTVLAVKTPLQLAKAMVSELRTTWGTAFAPASGTINDFLAIQTSQTTTDVDSNVAPNLDKVQGRFAALMKTAQFFDDGKAYSYPTNTFFMTTGVTPDASQANVLVRNSNNLYSIWYLGAEGSYCWTDSPTGLITTARCAFAGRSSPDYANNRLRYIVFEVTSTGANQYSYKTYRYNWAITFTGQGQPQFSGYPTLVTQDTVGNKMPSGAGTFSKTTSGSQITGLTMNGTFTPSATLYDEGKVLTTGVDTLSVSAVRTALTAANNYRYAFSGSVSTSKLLPGTTGATDPTKVVTESFDPGSYFDADETNMATTGGKVLVAKFIGTVQTLATKFTGSFDLSAPGVDADGLNYAPTRVVFNGSISNLSGANVGQFLTGKLDMAMNSYGSYRSTQPETALNYAHIVATFTGTLQAPSRPLLTLTTTATKTGPTTSTATLKYSYGLDVEVNGTTSQDSASSAPAILVLTNQNNVVVRWNNTANTGTITMPTVVDPATPQGQLGTISGGVVYYNDGTSESFN